MPTPKSEKQIVDFLHLLYGEDMGQVYFPTKAGERKEDWDPRFEPWPQHKSVIIDRIKAGADAGIDVYVSPALWKSNARPNKANWLGSRWVYVDFDGNAPESCPDSIPQPTIIIQSSGPKNQHWYWRLNEFYEGKENRDALEHIGRSLALKLGADISGWDSTQVLRVPGTKHRVKGTWATLLSHNPEAIYNLVDFRSILVDESDAEIEIKIREAQLPLVETVLMRHQFSDDALEIWNREKELVEGRRDEALSAFIHELLEVKPKMTKPEILALTNHLAYKWDKWTTHSNRWARIIAVVKAAYKNHVVRTEDIDDDDLYAPEQPRSISELVAYLQFNPARWIVSGLFPEKSTLQIVGEANIGKSSLALRLCADVVCGNDFLMWEHGDRTRDHRILYLGFDMDEGDAVDLINGIMETLNVDQKEAFGQAFEIATPDYGIDLFRKEVQARYEEIIANSRPTIVVLDSLKDTGALDGEDRRKTIFQWIKQKLMRELGLSVIVLTHTRKRDKDSKVHQTQDDVYGSGMQNADIKASLLLYKESASDPHINVNQTKVRRAAKKPVFAIKRSDTGLKYEIVNDKVDTTEPTRNRGSGAVAEGYVDNLFNRNVIPDGETSNASES